MEWYRNPKWQMGNATKVQIYFTRNEDKCEFIELRFYKTKEKGKENELES